MTSRQNEIEQQLSLLGLLDKSREIYHELGTQAAISYIRSSHRLLSKVYHPDLNPKNPERAMEMQKRLNRIGRLSDEMSDEELTVVIRRGGIGKASDRKRILVVEDEFGLQELFRDVLVMEGYNVEAAVDGDSGLEIFLRFQPDLLITDVVMPKMNGIELVQKVRSVTPEIKVIYVSGYFGIRELKKQLDMDVSSYGYPTLAKPFKISALLELVNDYTKDKGRSKFYRGV